MKNDAMTLRNILLAGGLLAGFALLGVAAVAITHDSTREQIADNQRQALLDILHQVLPDSHYDNPLLEDTITVRDAELLGSDKEMTLYRGWRDGRPSAVVFSTVAPDGYSGEITILVGIDISGKVTGVRILSHKETPGLGDAIEREKSDWILGFDGRTLDHPETWAVKKDGGTFDQFTGATITPRAVVAAVHNALLFFEKNRNTIFPETT